MFPIPKSATEEAIDLIIAGHNRLDLRERFCKFPFKKSFCQRSGETILERMRTCFEMAEELRKRHWIFLRLSEIPFDFGPVEKAGYLNGVCVVYNAYKLLLKHGGFLSQDKLREHGLEVYGVKVSEHHAQFVFLPQGLSLREKLYLLQEFTGITTLQVAAVVPPTSLETVASSVGGQAAEALSAASAPRGVLATQHASVFSFFHPFTDNECDEIADRLSRIDSDAQVGADTKKTSI